VYGLRKRKLCFVRCLKDIPLADNGIENEFGSQVELFEGSRMLLLELRDLLPAFHIVSVRNDPTRG